VRVFTGSAERLVAEIEYAEWTQNDLLGQPRFQGFARTSPRAKDAAKNRRTFFMSGAKTCHLRIQKEAATFTKRLEPGPKVVKQKGKPIFVIQEHTPADCIGIFVWNPMACSKLGRHERATMVPGDQATRGPHEDHPME